MDIIIQPKELSYGFDQYKFYIYGGYEQEDLPIIQKINPGFNIPMVI